MSQKVDKITNILQFPNEVLGMIFRHLPKQQLSLGQTNKRFYVISCLITNCEMKIDLKNQREIEDNLESILNSKRRVTKLNIKNSGSSKNLELVLKKFGDEIKEMWLKNMKLDSKSLSHLNYACNLNELVLYKVAWKGKIPKNFKMNFSKLKILIVSYCQEKLMKCFDALPDDVLTELYLTYNDFNGNKKYFQNQKQIRKLKGDVNLVNCIELVDLEILHHFGDGNNGNPECFINTEKLNKICENLGKLKQLNIEVHENDQIDFSAIEKLENLKKFEVGRYESDFDEASFKTLRNKNIEKIWISSDTLSGVENISFGCPNISQIEVSGSLHETTIVSKILIHFPKLKILRVASENFCNPTEVINGFEHENLKELSIISDTTLKNVKFDILKCKKLEKITSRLEVINESFTEFIANQPSLKLLYIHCIGEFDAQDLDNLERLERVTRHLDAVVFTYLDKSGQIFFDFQNNFPVIEIKSHGTFRKYIIFKKNENVEVSYEIQEDDED